MSDSLGGSETAMLGQTLHEMEATPSVTSPTFEQQARPRGSFS